MIAVCLRRFVSSGGIVAAGLVGVDPLVEQHSEQTTAERPRAVRWTVWLKRGLFVAVLAFLAHRVVGIWRTDGASLSRITLRWPWVAPAAAAYLAGWLPSVWFWRRMMCRLGTRPGFLDAARAYYCGHLGKYIPGKAAVLIIRAALIRERGFAAGPAAIAAAVETLAMMGSGCAVAAALAPLLLSDDRLARSPAWAQAVMSRPWAPALLVVAAFLALIPISSRLITVVSRRMTPRAWSEDGAVEAIDAGLLTSGFAAFILSWSLHGLSLGCALLAVGAENVTLGDWPVWTGAVSLATAVGFAVLLAPGGLGVREAILIEVLRNQPGLSTEHAVAGALLLRVLWLGSEVAASGALYYGVRRPAAARSRSGA